MDSSQWTEQDVREVLSNPVYTGIGAFPRHVSDEQWIQAQGRLVQEHGVRPRLRAIRAALHTSLGRELPRLAGSTWLDEAYRAVATEGLGPFLRRFLEDVRADLADQTPPAPVA